MSVGDGWNVMGREDAPVTMVEFTDYQCPFCRRFEADSFAQLKKARFALSVAACLWIFIPTHPQLR